jgi:hypothetical protein
MDFEVVPAAQRQGHETLSLDRQATTPRNHEPEPEPVQRPSTTNLKDLFAPREDEGEILGLSRVINVVPFTRFSL